MDKLQKHYDDLIKNYRQIFTAVLGAIQAEISTMSKEQIKDYLENEVERNIQHQRELISERRKNCECVKCGACCRLAISEFSYDELSTKSKNGDNYATQFITVFKPYETVPKELFKEYIELIEDSGENVYYYYCPKVTEGNMCSDYEHRPQICRDYPDNPLQLLHPTCSFERWHSSIQNIVLTIKAMSEIKTHFMNELVKEK